MYWPMHHRKDPILSSAGKSRKTPKGSESFNYFWCRGNKTMCLQWVRHCVKCFRNFSSICPKKLYELSSILDSKLLVPFKPKQYESGSWGSWPLFSPAFLQMTAIMCFLFPREVFSKCTCPGLCPGDCHSAGDQGKEYRQVLRGFRCSSLLKNH